MEENGLLGPERLLTGVITRHLVFFNFMLIFGRGQATYLVAKPYQPLPSLLANYEREIRSSYTYSIVS